MSIPNASLPPSPSSARLVGDDVQHLIVWYWCLRACAPGSDIESVEVEVDGVGNLDDVRVRFSDGRQQYWQVKAAVSAGALANTAWLTERKRAGSLIQRLFMSWDGLGRPGGGVALVTGRLIDPTDPLLRQLDRLDRLGPRLRRSNDPQVIEARKTLVDHIGCGVTELCDFFDALEIHVGQSERHWRGKVDDAALAAGVRIGDDARARGLEEVRDWVKTTRSPRTREDLAKRLRNLGLMSGAPRAIVVVEALDVVQDAAPDDIRLDWKRHFRGESPQTRRGTLDPTVWNDVLARDLADLRRQLSHTGQHSVVVRGQMRLPAWFAIGNALSDVAGFNVAAMVRGALWEQGTEAVLPDVVVQRDERTQGAGGQVALVVQVSTEGLDDVRVALGDGVGRLVGLTLSGGPNRRLLVDGASAFAGAVAVRDWVRRNLNGCEIHLVLIANGPFALFLGHLWDRVPPTTIYEDLAPGYEPAFRFRNS